MIATRYALAGLMQMAAHELGATRPLLELGRPVVKGDETYAPRSGA